MVGRALKLTVVPRKKKIKTVEHALRIIDLNYLERKFEKKSGFNQLVLLPSISRAGSTHE